MEVAQISMMVGRITLPTTINIHVLLIPTTYEDVTLHGKMDFVIKLRILSWESNPRISEGAQCNHKRPYEGWKVSWREEGREL